MKLLENKTIFLTGGTEGIGYECAIAYRLAGANLAIISNSLDSIAQARKTLDTANILLIQADVSNGPDIEKAVNKTLNYFGSIDAVHNNAGVSDPSKTLCETTAAEWSRLFDVNVKGIYHTTCYTIDALKRSKGSILNTSSIVGQIGQERHAAYAATKGAVDALTKAMALDYAPYGVRVNAVAPAGVWTPMLRRWSMQQPNPVEIEKYLNDIHPLGDCPQGDVVADACVFLLSDMARFITGCTLPVGGGAELGYRKTDG